MKLLNKQSVIVQKTSERKREVEEGMKLAKSVDVLRETHSKEQISLKKFRDETLRSIKEETDILFAKKNSILKEIESLEDRKKQAQAPIDLTNEWKKVEKDKHDLLQRETNVISREVMVQNLDKREKNLIEKEKEAKKYLEAAQISYNKTDELRNQMEIRKNESDIVINDKLSLLQVKEKEIVDRELIVSQELEHISKEKSDILLKGTNLIERESKIQSQIKSFFEREELIKEKEALTKRYNDEAVLNYDKSEIVKLNSERLRDESEKEINSRYLKVSEKERELGYRERDIVIEKENIENDRKAIEKEKLHIASQQETLRQAWNNIKNLQK